MRHKNRGPCTGFEDVVAMFLRDGWDQRCTDNLLQRGSWRLRLPTAIQPWSTIYWWPPRVRHAVYFVDIPNDVAVEKMLRIIEIVME